MDDEGVNAFQETSIFFGGVSGLFLCMPQTPKNCVNMFREFFSDWANLAVAAVFFAY